MPRKRIARRGRTGVASSSTAPQGTLALDTSNIGLSAFAGESAFVSDEVFTVTNTGAGAFANPQVSDDAAWLTLGVVTNADGTLTITPTVDPSALAAGSYTGTITITDANVTNSGLTATVTLLVNAAVPAISLSRATINLSVASGGTTPDQSVVISNGGQGTLAAPTVGTISYTGAFTGWVTSGGIADNGDDTYTYTFSIDAVGGSAGSYSASIQIVSAGASNTPATVTVNLTVTATQSAIILLDRSLDDTRGQAQTVGIQGGGPIPLAGPTISATSYSGDFADWATVTLVGNSLTVTPDLTGLPDGTGFVHVDIADANASATARYSVVLVVNQPSQNPIGSVSPPALAPIVVVGNNPSPQTITLANVNGSLPALGTVTVDFPSPVTWASAAYANGLITVSYSSTALSTGTYATTLRITMSAATNSPITIPITLTVSATSATYPIPQIATSPAGYTWDANLGYPTGSIFNTLASFRDADDGAMPAFAGTVVSVSNQSEWNSAIADAAAGVLVDGDVIEIAAGTVLNNVQLPVRSGWSYGSGGFIQIRTSAHASLPAYSYADGPDSYGNANRVDRTRDAALFATFRTTTTSQSTLLTQQGCGGYWLTGIDFYADTPQWTYYNVNLTAHSGSSTTTQNQVSHCPTQIVIERCSFRENFGTLNKLRLDGRHISVRHCDIGLARSGGSTDSTTFEAHGILVVNTVGPVEVLGNAYAAAGIAFFVGGGDPAIKNAVPTDSVNMWNRVWCPPTAYLDPDGDDYKNAFEHKTGRRFIHAFNDIRYIPYHTQQNYTLLTKAVDQQTGNSGVSGDNYAAHTTDIVFWCNRIRNCAKGFYQSIDISDWTSTAAIGSERIEACYNLHIYDPTYVKPSRAPIPATNKRGTALYASKGDGIPVVRVEHNTFSADNAQSLLHIDETAVNRSGWRNVVYSNNVFVSVPSYGPVFGGNDGDNSVGLNAVFGAGNWQFRRNYVMAGGATWDQTLAGGNNNNKYIQSVSAFNNPAAWDYSLVPSATDASASFPGGGGGTDGTDCGYNHAYMVAMLGDIGD